MIPISVLLSLEEITAGVSSIRDPAGHGPGGSQNLEA